MSTTESRIEPNPTALTTADPGFAAFEPALQRAYDLALAYLGGLPARPVSQRPDAATMAAALDEPLPETGVPPVAALDEWLQRAEAGIVASAGPRFFGFVFADVVGLDYAPTLLQCAARRAEAEGLAIELVEGDAEALPFPDASFDVVLSAVGVMFAPNQSQAAGELRRVCRSGGRSGLATWTPDSFIGELLKVVGRYVPPPEGLDPPTRWGTEAGLGELLSEDVDLDVNRQEQRFRYRSPEHFATFFRSQYGPIERAFAAIDTDAQEQLHADLVALAERWNVVTDGTVVAPDDYLEVVARAASPPSNEGDGGEVGRPHRVS